MQKENLRFFIINVLVSLIIAAVGYSFQFIIFYDWFSQYNIKFFQFFRMIRMVFGYVIIPLFFLYYTNQKFTEMGLKFKSFKDFILALVLGIGIYLVPSYIFVRYEIFTAQWKYRGFEDTVILLILIGIMASVTDSWTRGFVLLQLNKSHGKVTAILIQNILWFVLHIYEILLLIPYIGLTGSIALTIFLGITGDLVAIHYKNISGLMLGHIILNVSIALAGQGYIIL